MERSWRPMRLSTGRFGMRLVDSIHRFDLRCDSSIRFVHWIEVWFCIMSSTPLDSTTRPGGMREAIKSAARSEAEEQGVLDRSPRAQSTAKSPHLKAIICLKISANLKKQVYSPPYNPPRRPAHSAGPAKMDHKIRLVVDQNFDRFLTSIFGRFGVVLGRQVGVILGTFGGQDRPRSVQNASWKPINIKNVNFHQILRFPIPELYFGPQDGLQNAPRSAQDGSKRLLKSNFFALENPLKIISSVTLTKRELF